MKDLGKIRLIVSDVDGTMTDGGIYYDENGNELKKFCTRDAAGFFTAHSVGIQIMVLTGRACSATSKRMSEMKVDYLCQNVQDKYSFLHNFLLEKQYEKEEIAYIGDDLNDLYAMNLCGYKGCPADAYTEIKEVCDYVSSRNGGEGAVRDFIQHILQERGQWEMAYHTVYHIPIQ